jgi:hypothetical protein
MSYIAIASSGLLSVLLVSTVAAQRVVDSDRAYCDSVVARVDQGVWEAFRELQSCRASGPIALARQWSNPQTDSIALGALSYVSALMSDRRLLAAIREALLRATSPRSVRLAAIRALAGQYDPQVAIEFRMPRDSNFPGAAFVMMGELTDSPGVQGAEPTSPEDRRSVLDILEQVSSSSGSDEIVRKIAGYVRQRLVAR